MANFPPYQFQPQMNGYGQQMQPYYPMQQQAPESLFCRMATNRDEVQAYPVDFSGKPMTFLGPGMQTIWVKAFDPNSGGSVVAEYRRTAPEETAKPYVVTMDDFQSLKAAFAELQEEVSRLRTARRRSNREEATDDEV